MKKFFEKFWDTFTRVYYDFFFPQDGALSEVKGIGRRLFAVTFLVNLIFVVGSLIYLRVTGNIPLSVSLLLISFMATNSWRVYEV